MSTIKEKEKRPKSQSLGKKRQRQQSPNHDPEKMSEESNDTDDEQVKIRIGRVPYQWYDDIGHLGYDNKLTKVERKRQRDKVQEFIERSENKDWWRTITDHLNNRDIVLTDQQLELIDRIRSGKWASKKIATSDYQAEFPHDDPFPIHAHPPAKRNFQPSKWERLKVNKILEGILSGRIKPSADPVDTEQQLYDVWKTKLQNVLVGAQAVSAPKMALPTHHESYNPPEEYLYDEKEKEEWEQMDEEDRPTNFIPQKYDKLRHIPFYDKLINERFERCLDLYLAPRVKKKKLNMRPEQLIPKIPSPDELKPFPTSQNILYSGHTAGLSCLAVEPHYGNYFASGDTSGLLIIWQTLSSRCLFTKKFPQPVCSLDWSKTGLILIGTGQSAHILNWKYPRSAYELNESTFEEAKQSPEQNWQFVGPESEQYREGFRLRLAFASQVRFVQFHNKGDYFLTVCPEHELKNQVVMVHHLSKAASQKPFSKSKGLVKKVYFHNSKPQLFLMTSKTVLIFNLQKQAMEKKLKSGAEFNSSLCIHPYGDNIIVGSLDKRLLWYDLDLADKPYKTLEYHSAGITQCDFNKKYPLMATASNDGTIHILHAKVFTDLLQNALILPLKILKGHVVKDDEGVRDIKWHPTQPWIFSAGRDGKVCLWT